MAKKPDEMLGRIEWPADRAFSDVYYAAEKTAPGFGDALEKLLPAFDNSCYLCGMLTWSGEAAFFEDGTVAVTPKSRR
jgi:hypothetical protein